MAIIDCNVNPAMPQAGLCYKQQTISNEQR